MGEFARIELEKSWNDELDINQIIGSISSSNNMQFDEDYKDYFEKLISDYLFDDDENLNILNPFLFLYLPKTGGKEHVGEFEIARFFRDVFFAENEEFNLKFKSFLEKSSSDHIIIELILKNISELNNKKIDDKYIPILKNIVDLFVEDMLFLLKKNGGYLLNNIDLIFAYYYYFYSSQLILKLGQDFNSNLESDEKLFYILDWESVNKNRKTVKLGYNRVKIESKNLFSKVCLIDQLNTLIGTKGLLLNDMASIFNSFSSDKQNEFLSFLNKWILDYRNVRGINNSYDDGEFIINSSESNKFVNLVNLLFVSLNNEEKQAEKPSSVKGIDLAVKNRYSLNIEEIGKRYFLKRRGRYGYVSNLTQEMLLLITSLCIKKDKIKLKQLFKEYEKRGLYFDRYSKEEITNLLTKLNLIDKKSDSGDAQYVKAIL